MIQAKIGPFSMALMSEWVALMYASKGGENLLPEDSVAHPSKTDDQIRIYLFDTWQSVCIIEDYRSRPIVNQVYYFWSISIHRRTLSVPRESITSLTLKIPSGQVPAHLTQDWKISPLLSAERKYVPQMRLFWAIYKLYIKLLLLPSAAHAALRRGAHLWSFFCPWLGKFSNGVVFYRQEEERALYLYPRRRQAN